MQYYNIKVYTDWVVRDWLFMIERQNLL